MLVVTKKQKLTLLIIAVFLVVGLLVSYIVIQSDVFKSSQSVDNTNDAGQSELPYSDPKQLINQIIEEKSQSIESRYESATTVEEKLNANIEKMTVALESGDNTKALEYAKAAYNLEGMNAAQRHRASMNLVSLYGEINEFELGLDILKTIREDEEIMAIQNAEFYVSRFETAYQQAKMPDPINCSDPKTPEDCPL